MRLAALAVSTCVFAASDATAAGAPSLASTPAPTACDLVLNEARAALLSESPLEPHDANRLHRAVLHAVGGDHDGCAARFAGLLESSVCRGSALGVVASASFAAGALPPGITASLVDRAVASALSGDPACARQILPAVQQASRVDAGLADAVFRAANAEDAALADAGWLVLGTIAKTARDDGDETLARRIDAEIDAALRAEPMDRLTSLVEAAGNSGCQACAGTLDDLTRSGSDPWLRRASAGAWRFLPTGAGPMCRALRDDPSAIVREHAAWALGFSTADSELRAGCLRQAAASDDDEDVRSTASRSLDDLRREERTP